MEHRFFVASALVLGIYATHVLIGKVASLWKFALPLELGDVGEFLLVLGAMVFFVVGMMLREAREQRQNALPPPQQRSVPIPKEQS